MPAEQRIDREEQAVDDKKPPEEQVPLPSHCQDLGAGNGRPCREGPALAVRIAEYSRGIEFMAQDCCDATHLAVLHLHGADREERMLTVGTVVPIEGGMRVENLESAHDQDDKDRNVKPMADSYR